MIIKLQIWVLLWFGVFGIANLLLKERGFKYTKKAWVYWILFGYASYMTYLIFNEQFTFLRCSISCILIIILFTALQFLIYYLLKKYTKDCKPVEKAGYTYISYIFLISKGFEIVFQDLLIFVLLSIIGSIIKDSYEFIFAFLLFFGVLHTPLIFISKEVGFKFLIVSSFLLGFMPPLLYLLPNFNFAYLYCAHWLFYLLGGIGYRLVPGFRKMLNRKIL